MLDVGVGDRHCCSIGQRNLNQAEDLFSSLQWIVEKTKLIKGTVIVVKRHLRSIATLASLALIYFALDGESARRSVWTADLRFLLIAVLLFFPIQYLAAYRWHFILSRLDQVIPFFTILRHSVLGQLSTLFLPGQVSGDIVKFLLVSHRREEKVPIALSLAIDKATILLAVAGFAMVGALAGGPLSRLTEVKVAASIVIVVVFPMVVLLCQYRKDQTRLIRFASRVRWLPDFIVKTIKALPAAPPMPTTAVLIVILTALALVCSYSIGTYFVALSLRIELNPIDWLAINAIVSFIQIFPLTIGGIGVRESAFGVILSLYGVPFSQAVVFSLTGFALGALSTGLFFIALNLIQRETTAK